MSQLAAHPPHGADPLARDNITLGRVGISTGLLALGAVLLAVVAIAAFALDAKTHALASVHTGAMSVLAICLGAMFFTMIFHLTQAGWTATIRRQFENVMSLVWVPVVIVGVIVLLEITITQGSLFTWLNEHIAGKAGVDRDFLLEQKSAYLNPLFFVIRLLIYVGAWMYLSRRLWAYSTEQDRTGDKWLSNKARFTSSWGMLVFALTTAFAAFDLLMSLDWRFYSTMWGVYYFAGAAFCSVPVVVIVLGWLRRAGKLEGAVTDEHLHDLAKLMFGFTVFWAYIAFSQYFLIWYSNIPEETSFFLIRKTNGWQYFTIFLCIGHFVLPWYILLWKKVRRNFTLLSIMAAWAVLMEVLDIAWIVRPMVYAADEHDKIHAGMIWLDAAGAIGVFCIFAGLLARKVASGPLVPLHDPRIAEALHHRNYV